MIFITGNSLGHPHGAVDMDETVGKLYTHVWSKKTLHLPVGLSGEESSGGVWTGGKPSEEERTSWEQQRQRREKLSSLMGQYLLKGYRMLGSNCSDCGVCTMQSSRYTMSPRGERVIRSYDHRKFLCL